MPHGNLVLRSCCGEKDRYLAQTMHMTYQYPYLDNEHGHSTTYQTKLLNESCNSTLTQLIGLFYVYIGHKDIKLQHICQ